MDRRTFLATTATGALASSAARAVGPPPAAPPRRRPLVGHQNRSADADLRVLSALGVQAHLQRLPSRTLDDNWSVEGLTGSAQARREVRHQARHGAAAAEHLADQPRPRSRNIMLGKSPERDREIDTICARSATPPGPACRGQVQPHNPWRGADRATPGRGGSSYSTFVYDKAKQDTLRRRPGRSAQTRPGSGSPISSSGSCRWRRSARCGSAVTRTTPPCRPIRASAASIASWAASTA